MTDTASHYSSEVANQTRDLTRAPEVHVLVEHANRSAAEFNRLGRATFSAEDRVALKHVAGVLATLAAVALAVAIILVAA